MAATPISVFRHSGMSHLKIFKFYQYRFLPHPCHFIIHFSLYQSTANNLHCRHLSIHSAVSLTTGPQPLPKPVLHTVRSSASSFNLYYPPVSLRSSSSCLRPLLHLPVTSILPSIFPSITCSAVGSVTK